MHAFDILGDPVRRRLIELLDGGELTAGDLASTIGNEFGISQPAVSQHLRVLRENGFANVRSEGTRRFYSVDPSSLRAVDEWLDRFRHYWAPKLAALDTEIARGTRERRNHQEDP